MSTTNYYEESLLLHKSHKGKLEVVSKVSVKTREELSVVYTPGIAKPCLLIARSPEEARKHSIKSNTVAVVSDGSDVFGLGNIGGLASLPAMEGKAVLFKELGGVDAFPICLSTQDTDGIVETVKNIAPAFGGISLEGIEASRLVEIEERLKKGLDIPVFHDGGHSVAVVACAAVINAFRLLKKPLKDVHALVCGAGVGGSHTAKMLYAIGVRDIVICDSKGILSASRLSEFDEYKLELLEFTNKDRLEGSIEDALEGRDLFIGLSKPRLLTSEMVRMMAKDPVVFALANPEPEIFPDLAKFGGASITATGRPDFSNYIDTALAFPGVFRGALDAEAKEITEAMKMAAVHAIAEQVSDGDLSEECILPDVFKEGLASEVAKAVADAWAEEGMKRDQLAVNDIYIFA